MALTGALVLVLASTLIITVRDTQAREVATSREVSITYTSGCFGANATLRTGHCPRPFDISRAAELVLPYVDLDPEWCLTWFDQDWLSCGFGDVTDAVGTIVLVGDSHAAALANHMGEYFAKHGWRVVSFTRFGCPRLSPIPFGLDRQTPAAELAYAVWTRRATAELITRQDIDIVLYTSHEAAYSYPESPGAVRFDPVTVAATLSQVVSPGKDVVMLRDVPELARADVPTCVASASSARKDCSVGIGAAFPDSPQDRTGN